MEKEPGCPITRNGETFNSNDLKGLITMIYDGSDIETVFTGLRCDITKPSFDTYGRYNRKECRDISPDFLHLAMTNLIGIRNRAFVIDLEAKSPVWNQPVLGYSVDKLEKLSISEAGRLFGERRYSFNDDANALYHVKTRFFWINESEEAGPLIKNGRVNAYILAENYEYVLEVDSKNRIVGGEWVGKSMANHPDFLWVPITGPRMDTVVLEGISYTEVRSMIEESYRTNC